MAETVEIPIVDLLLDGGNPRLETEESGQQETALRLAAQEGVANTDTARKWHFWVPIHVQSNKWHFEAN